MEEAGASISKGKRTKRPRTLFPPTSSSAEFSEEDEDMANCLILLACGRVREEGASTEKLASRRAAEKPGLCAYECKTCNKCFPSFQALGGHRASHKKPRLAAGAQVEEDDGLRISLNSFSKPAPGGKPKVHECSICGAEFSSGQALGGHMRRHRPLGEAPPEGRKDRNVLPLDLNLPAPSDDDRSEFAVPPLAPERRRLLFSASALVDCHY